MAIAAYRSRLWLAGGAVVVVWGVAWTAVVATRHAPPVALAAAFDFVITANLALWWIGRRDGRAIVPRWMFGATLAIGLLFARLVLAGAHGGGLAVAVVGGGLELAVVVAVVVRFKRARAAFRTARAAGEGGFAALIAALEATRMPRVVATVIATEVYVFAMAIGGWRRPAPKLTLHRTNGFTLYAGVFGFLIVAETPAVHIALSMVSPIAAWIATGASIYSLFWLAGYANAVRHGGVLVRDGEIELRIGVRWRARIARVSIASVDVVAEAPAGVLDASIMGANTVVRFAHPVRIDGMFGRVREVDAIALSVDDRAAFQLAFAEPLTRA
jgi:hypothetical protein